jgi:hypothetical protein
MANEQLLAQLLGEQGVGDPRGSFFDESSPTNFSGDDRRGKALGHRLAREKHEQLADILSALGLQQQGELGREQLQELTRHQGAEEDVQKMRAEAAQTAAGSKDTIFNHAQALAMIYGPEFAKKWLGQQDPVIGGLLADQEKKAHYTARLGDKKNPLSPEETSELARLAPELGLKATTTPTAQSKGGLFPPVGEQARMLGQAPTNVTSIGAPVAPRPTTPATPPTTLSAASPFAPGSQLGSTVREGVAGAGRGTVRGLAGGATNVADFLKTLFTGQQVSRDESSQRFNQLLKPRTVGPGLF